MKNKLHFLKFIIFNQLKTHYFYSSQFKNKQINLPFNNKDPSLINLCSNCDKKLITKDKKDFEFKIVNNKNKNICANCNQAINSDLIPNSGENENLQLKDFSIENKVIIYYERKLLVAKVKCLFQSIFKNISNKQKSFIGKYFIRWNNANKYRKYYSNIKNEYEKKHTNKLEAKMQENNKLIKKLDKEKVQIKIKNESLMQSIQVNTLKINTFKDKEKNLNDKLKALTNENKKVLSDLQKNEVDIDNKISNFENIGKEMELQITKLKEAKLEKNIVLNKYIEEMNQVLDIYEKKTSNFFVKTKFKLN